MTLTRIASFAVVAGLMALGIGKIRDPHRTMLPVGTADLSSVRPQLDALSDTDRALVLGYVQRSRGDVLPPKFADPDAPLTARTFAEAIELQRRFLAGQAVIDAQTEARRRARSASASSIIESPWLQGKAPRFTASTPTSARRPGIVRTS